MKLFDTETKTVSEMSTKLTKVEVTDDYAAYLSTSPGPGYELKLVKKGDQFVCTHGDICRSYHDYKDEGPHDRGYRWVGKESKYHLVLTLLDEYSVWKDAPKEYLLLTKYSTEITKEYAEYLSTPPPFTGNWVLKMGEAGDVILSLGSHRVTTMMCDYMDLNAEDRGVRWVLQRK